MTVRQTGLLAALTALAATAFVAAADDDDDTAGQEHRDTPFMVAMTPAVQARAGVQTLTLEAVRRRVEMPALAQVLPLGPLLTQRGEVIAARAAAKIAAAKHSAARDTYERLRTLHGENANVSGRELAQARADWQSAQAQLEAARAKRGDARSGFAHAWSEPLAAAAMAGDSEEFAALRQGREVLAILMLPAGRSLPKTADTVYLARDDNRSAARPAHIIAPAAATQGSGETWLLRTDATGLRTGMRLHAWVPIGDDSAQRLRVPAKAVIWQGGQPWVYIQTEPDLFERRPVPAAAARSGDAWLVDAGFTAGEALVTVGAQLLLSQELRASIPEEDDD